MCVCVCEKMRERKTEMSNIPSRDLAPWFQLVEMRECDKSSAPIGRLHFSECNRIKLDAPFDISLGTMNGALLDHLKGCINDSEKSSRSTVPSSVNPLSLSPSPSLFVFVFVSLLKPGGIAIEYGTQKRARVQFPEAVPKSLMRFPIQNSNRASSAHPTRILRKAEESPPTMKGGTWKKSDATAFPVLIYC